VVGAGAGRDETLGVRRFGTLFEDCTFACGRGGPLVWTFYLGNSLITLKKSSIWQAGRVCI
jgi:hypothetical protein